MMKIVEIQVKTHLLFRTEWLKWCHWECGRYTWIRVDLDRWVPWVIVGRDVLSTTYHFGKLRARQIHQFFSAHMLIAHSTRKIAKYCETDNFRYCTKFRICLQFFFPHILRIHTCTYFDFCGLPLVIPFEPQCKRPSHLQSQMVCNVWTRPLLHILLWLAFLQPRNGSSLATKKINKLTFTTDQNLSYA